MSRILCRFGFHKWVFYDPLKDIVACGRKGCLATKDARTVDLIGDATRVKIDEDWRGQPHESQER